MPSASPDEVARMSLAHLEALVRVDSQSDEASDTIPSTEGQRTLGDQVAAFFRDLGLEVERDGHANVIATRPGRGAGEGDAPVALMTHLDTSRGTGAVDELAILDAWDGRAVPYSANPALQVDIETYPAARLFLGQDLVHGPGRAPFGLDNKLGLAHMMTLARLLVANPDIGHPPLYLVARPDEEIGRMAAVEGLADLLASRGVAYGYTLDGLEPFEINVENFNASVAAVHFTTRDLEDWPGPLGRFVTARIGGVNTHGATAKAEGFRAATRLAAEVVARLTAGGHVPDRIVPVAFASDALRDCDGIATFLVGGSDPTAVDAALSALKAALGAVVDPHVPRGASWEIDEGATGTPDRSPLSAASWVMLRYVDRFLGSAPGFTLAAEDSEGFDGYSAPYRARPTAEGMRLDVRLRDFGAEGLRARERHVERIAAEAGAGPVEVTAQYVNMGPRVADRRELVDWPTRAAAAIGAEALVLPIRGGTGVDPFLDRGIPIANLGTGYFSPESEKEFTSLQMMARHAQWLVALVQTITAG